MNKLSMLLLLALASMIIAPQSIQAARILSVFPAVSKSHFAVGEALTLGLARAGHEVTLVSPYDYKSPVATLDVVQLTGVEELAAGKFTIKVVTIIVVLNPT